MFKIFPTILATLLVYPAILFAAEGSQNSPSGGDMTTTNFTIDLGNMDPLRRPSATPAGEAALLVILDNVSSFLLFMIPIIAIISGIFAGYYYIFSAGDSEKAGRAKNIIKWNIIAIVVAFLSLSIIRLVASLFT